MARIAQRRREGGLSSGMAVPAKGAREAMALGDGRTCLVVDDDRNARDACRELLEAQGFEVQTAMDAYEAIERVRGGRFDAVITDLDMPGDGASLIEYVRFHHPRTPLILVTAEPFFFDDGVAAHLTKPVSSEEIVGALECALGGGG